MKFEMNHKESSDATAWCSDHYASCKIPCGAIGGQFTYAFTGTSLGTCVVISCRCGDSKNVTDFDEW